MKYRIRVEDAEKFVREFDIVAPNLGVLEDLDNALTAAGCRPLGLTSEQTPKAMLERV